METNKDAFSKHLGNNYPRRAVGCAGVVFVGVDGVVFDRLKKFGVRLRS